MISISDIVFQIVHKDEFLFEAMRLGIINYRALARVIQAEVEAACFKPVTISSLVVALSRLRPRISKLDSVRPTIIAEDLAIKGPLAEISYDQSKNLDIKLASFVDQYVDLGIFSIIRGVGETSIVAKAQHVDAIIKYFDSSPKGIYLQLTAVTIRFDEKRYLEVPNTIYSLVAALACHRINIIELISTFSEVSFVVRSVDAEQTMAALQSRFVKK